MQYLFYILNISCLLLLVLLVLYHNDRYWPKYLKLIERAGIALSAVVVIDIVLILLWSLIGFGRWVYQFI